MIDSQPALLKEVAALISKAGLDGLKSRLAEKVYKMLAKLKKNNKQINESVINRDDFLEVMKSIDGTGLSEETQSLMQPLV